MKHIVTIPITIFLVISGCCDSPSLPLWRMGGYMEATFELDSSINPTGAFDYQASALLDSWCVIETFSSADLGVNIGANATAQTTSVEYDIDNDAFDETVEVLIITDPNTPQVPYYFYQWHSSDKFSVDSGKTYLAWVQGTEVFLIGANDDDDAGLMLCNSPDADGDNASCTQCTADFECASCDMDKNLSNCVPRTKKDGSTNIGTSGSISGNLDIDLDIGSGLELGF